MAPAAKSKARSKSEATEKMIETKKINKAARETSQKIQQGFAAAAATGIDREREKIHKYLDGKKVLTLTLWSLMEGGLLESLLNVDDNEQEAAVEKPVERKKLREGSRKFHQVPKAVALSIIVELNEKYGAAFSKSGEGMDVMAIFYHALHVVPETDLPLKQDKEFQYIDSFTKWCVWRHEKMGKRLEGELLKEHVFWSVDTTAKTFSCRVGHEVVTWQIRTEIDAETTTIERPEHMMAAKLICTEEGLEQTLVTLAMSKVNAKVTKDFKRFFTGHQLPPMTDELKVQILGEEAGAETEINFDDSVSQIGARAATVVSTASASSKATKAKTAVVLEQELKSRCRGSGSVKAAMPAAPPKKKARRT